MRFSDRIKWSAIEAYERRELLKQMVVSKLIVNQKDFMLGYLWWIIEPIILTFIYWLVFHKIFERGGPNYHIFILCGLIPFKAVSSSFNQSLSALGGNVGLMSQLAFPRVFLPLADVITNHVKLLFSFLIVVITSIFYLNIVSINFLLFILPFLFQVLLLCGVALLFSVFGIYFADLKNIVQLCIRALLFLSPIFYDIDRIPIEYRQLYLIINPLAPMILSYRDIFINGMAPRPEYLIILCVESVSIFIIGYLFFHQHERKILKYI